MRISKLTSIPTHTVSSGVAFTMLAVMLIAFIAAMLTFAPREGVAKPAYAQKTGYPCTKCHTGTPSKQSVNAFGKAWEKKH